MPNTSDESSALSTILKSATEGKQCSFRPLSDISLRLFTSYSPSEINQTLLNELLVYIERQYGVELEIACGGAGCVFIFWNVKASQSADFQQIAKALEDPFVQEKLEGAGAQYAAFVGSAGVRAIQRKLSSEVFFITNRGPDITSTNIEALRFGTIRVSGLRSTKESDENSVKSGLLRSVWHKITNLPRGDIKNNPRISDIFWFEDLDEFTAVLSMRAANDHNLLFYVHGYNNTFEESGVALARLRTRSNFSCLQVIPLMFSWPSSGRRIDYLKDVERAKKSQIALIEGLGICTKNIETNVLAHSHGATLLVDALSLAENDLAQHRRPPIKELIFVAPDVGADFFDQRKLRIAQNCDRATMYVSKTDLALSFSKSLWGGDRAGTAVVGLSELAENIDIIDVSGANSTEVLGHSHHICIAEVSYDIAAVLNGRGLRERASWLRGASRGGRLYRLVTASAV